MRSFTWFALVAVVGSLTGCVVAEEPPVVAKRSALGEPTNGFPSAAERLGIMAINRARSDPATVKGTQSAAYPARPPVMWSYDLSRSARFHATSLRLSNVTLMHPSPCALNTNVATSGCNGDPACACATPVPTACAACANVGTTTCGTDPFVRIALFTAGTTARANGEVAAAGYADPIAVVDGWMDEAAGADGHRKNLTDQGIASTVMGYGRIEGAGCFSSFDVSDSGNATGTVVSKLPTAAVRAPTNGAAGSYMFYATWADPALGAPASLNVVIDGACTAMARELGTDTLNATYKATSTLAAGCHNYFMLAKDASGTTLAYPTTGAITISVGSATACTADFLATAPVASCAGDGGVTPPPPADSGTGLPRADAAVDRGPGATPDAGQGATGGGAGSGLGGASGGLGGAPGGGSAAGGTTGGGGGLGGGGSSGGTPGIDAGAGGNAGTTAPGDSISGGCNCGVGGARPWSWTGGFAMLGLVLVCGRRTRRRHPR
jgi:MYXO-CTERM domain-containing protein